MALARRANEHSQEEVTPETSGAGAQLSAFFLLNSAFA
jgi:hypothetical protein